jgi:hypothetical protein
MQGIENCIPETNHISRVYSIAATSYSPFVVIIIIMIIYNNIF